MRAANLLFLLFATDELPHPLHQEGQLPDVGVVVGRSLVAHARHDDDAVAVENGGVHVAKHLDVPFRVPLLQRIGRLVVVGDDGLPLPHRLAPQARVVTTG